MIRHSGGVYQAAPPKWLLEKLGRGDRHVFYKTRRKHGYFHIRGPASVCLFHHTDEDAVMLHPGFGDSQGGLVKYDLRRLFASPPFRDRLAADRLAPPARWGPLSVHQILLGPDIDVHSGSAVADRLSAMIRDPERDWSPEVLPYFGLLFALFENGPPEPAQFTARTGLLEKVVGPRTIPPVPGPPRAVFEGGEVVFRSVIDALTAFGPAGGGILRGFLTDAELAKLPAVVREWYRSGKRLGPLRYPIEVAHALIRAALNRFIRRWLSRIEQKLEDVVGPPEYLLSPQASSPPLVPGTRPYHGRGRRVSISDRPAEGVAVVDDGRISGTVNVADLVPFVPLLPDGIHSKIADEDIPACRALLGREADGFGLSPLASATTITTPPLCAVRQYMDHNGDPVPLTDLKRWWIARFLAGMARVHRAQYTAYRTVFRGAALSQNRTQTERMNAALRRRAEPLKWKCEGCRISTPAACVAALSGGGPSRGPPAAASTPIEVVLEAIELKERRMKRGKSPEQRRKRPGTEQEAAREERRKRAALLSAAWKKI